jgi:hypothetical protein
MQIPIGLMMVAGAILGMMTAASGYLFALGQTGNGQYPLEIR